MSAPAPTPLPGTWVLLRGLMRDSRHWGGFPQQFQARFPDARIETVDFPGNGLLHDNVSPASVPSMAEHAGGAEGEDHEGGEPEDRRAGVEARLQEHELAVAVDEVVLDGRVAVAGLQALAHEHAQILGEGSVGIVDRLVLADHAAKLGATVIAGAPAPCAGLVENLVGLHSQYAGYGDRAPQSALR